MPTVNTVRWSIGDVVKLKSGGGPNMTVDYVNDDGDSVICKWFVGNELKEGTFAPGSLERASPR